MCGVIGLVLANEKLHVTQELVDALTVLQHRGQDAAGIVTSKQGRLNLRKQMGTVAEVFTQESTQNLNGNMGIGHVRYPTAGGGCSAEAQPLYTNYPFGIALAHNGNLTNAKQLGESMRSKFRQINTQSDSELLLNVFANELQLRNLANMCESDIFDSVRCVMEKCIGGYSVVILINGIGMLAFRDPHGIRPLCFGSRINSDGSMDHGVASESVAIDALGPTFSLTRDVAPGEAIFISVRGAILTTRMVCSTRKFTPCIFEYVYFARPDSILDGVQVYEARSRMGEKLARKILRLQSQQSCPDNHPNITQLESKLHDIDVVIPIPETSRTAALTCAHLLDRPYREGFVKNRYIARTFIMPGQAMRKKTVRLKLNAIKSEFRNKVVLLVDDSIVRGTTSVELIQMARDAGARKVYFASAVPPVCHPNVYGIDIPTRSELVAHNRSVGEICALLGADWLVYNDLSDVMDAVRECNPEVLKDFDASCFDGRYITPDITEGYLSALECNRGMGRIGALSAAVAGVEATPSFSVSTPSGNTELTVGLFLAPVENYDLTTICETLHNNEL